MVTAEQAFEWLGLDSIHVDGPDLHRWLQWSRRALERQDAHYVEEVDLAGLVHLLDQLKGEPSPVAVTRDAPALDRSDTHVCTVCGRRFTGVRSDAKTCSSACRQRAYRERTGS